MCVERSGLGAWKAGLLCARLAGVAESMMAARRASDKNPNAVAVRPTRWPRLQVCSTKCWLPLSSWSLQGSSSEALRESLA